MTITREELLARFPNASESFIRRNLEAMGAPVAPAPLPASSPVVVAPPKPAKQAKKAKRQMVARTRNMGTWTEAEYWSRVRSALRRLSRFWAPARHALFAARIPCRGPRGQKWAYICAECHKPFPRKGVHIDHKTPAGKLTDYAHLPDFLRRLTPESIDDYQVLCLEHHQHKTNKERDSHGLLGTTD